MVDQAVYDQIEVMTNLVYLTKQNAADKTKILLYMTMAEEALQSLVEALKSPKSAFP